MTQVRLCAESASLAICKIAQKIFCREGLSSALFFSFFFGLSTEDLLCSLRAGNVCQGISDSRKHGAFSFTNRAGPRLRHISQVTRGICWPLSQSREAVALEMSPCTAPEMSHASPFSRVRSRNGKTEDGSEEVSTTSVCTNTLDHWKPKGCC